jgi:hypothetical protein
MVRQVIEHELPADQLAILRTAEKSERALIERLVSGLDGSTAGN